jgi:hypothetical protein
MTLNDIVSKSCFSTIATITNESIDKLNFFSQYNLDLIKRFPKVIISTNSHEDTSIHKINQYHNTWRKIAPNCIILHSDINRGHMFGTIDLEEAILNYVKTHLPDILYLWKSMDDVISTTDLINLDVEEADFYYLPGFSYESIQKANGKDNLFNIYETYKSGFWTPQTTFYILNVSDIHRLYGDDIEYKISVYQKEKETNPHIKPWELPFDIKFDCESHLGRTTKDLTKHSLIKDQFKDLADLVYMNRIGDPSHKQIYFEKIGICHYHDYKSLIYNV